MHFTRQNYNFFCTCANFLVLLHDILYNSHRIMKRQLIFFLAFAAMTAQAQKQNATYLAYIEEWKDVAVQQQADYGIPASITMAQALLESGAGQSELATKANNHFGIKCTSDWFGGVYYHDDETEGECFRQYYDAAESFKDHSLFLQRSRYSTCFEIAIEDYEGWAQRLRQCGYATDINYAAKLVKLIEDYRLDTLISYAPTERDTVAAPVIRGQMERPAERPADQKVVPGNAKKATVVTVKEPIRVINSDPEPPYVEPLTASEECKQFFLQHPKQKCNSLTYVEARKGDTYANVAFRINVRERELREWNDALGRDLEVGDRIYISRKKTSVPQEKAIMWGHPGESLWMICQREGIQMKRVQELNGFAPEVRVFKTRQKIYLNKVKEENVR